MITLPIATRQQTVASIAVTIVLLAGASCRPAPPSDSGQHMPTTDGGTPRQPNADDFNAFFQTLLPPVVKLSDVKTDSPMRMPNTSPNSNTWLIGVKITLTPVEDLLALPAPEDTQAINNLVGELNALITWRNAYARSPYANAYGAFEFKAPASSMPRLLVVQQARSKPLAPLYGKVAAEWQVDHWQFTNVDMELPQMGQPRSSFTGPTMVMNSPETNAFVAAEQRAIADGKQKQAAIEGQYAKDLLMATRPGTTYRGQISHPRGIVPCEVRFLDTPGAEPRMATFEIRVPQEPTYQYVYTAKLAPKVPLNIVADAATSQSFRFTAGDTEADRLVGNLTVNYVRGAGKKSLFGSLPSVMLNGAGSMGPDKPFLLLDGHLKGVVSSFNGNFSLAAGLIR